MIGNFAARAFAASIGAGICASIHSSYFPNCIESTETFIISAAFSADHLV
jgi:hypothetical protein